MPLSGDARPRFRLRAEKNGTVKRGGWTAILFRNYVVLRECKQEDTSWRGGSAENSEIDCDAVFPGRYQLCAGTKRTFGLPRFYGAKGRRKARGMSDTRSVKRMASRRVSRVSRVLVSGRDASAASADSAWDKSFAGSGTGRCRLLPGE